MRRQAPLDKCFSCAPFSVFPPQLIADIKRGVLENEKLIRLYFISPFIVVLSCFFVFSFLRFFLCFVSFFFLSCLSSIRHVFFSVVLLVLFYFCFVLFYLFRLLVFCLFFFSKAISTVTVVFLHRHQLYLLWNL